MNKRYAHRVEAMSALRTAQVQLADEGGPISLGAEQLKRAELPTTTYPEAVRPKVYVWVTTHRGTHLELPGVVVAETPYAAAVLIQFPPARAEEYRVWVWLGACSARKSDIDWGPGGNT